MKHRITRRDFLNGTQVAIGASLLTPWTDVFGANAVDFTLGSNYYPPAKMGLRGSHDGRESSRCYLRSFRRATQRAGETLHHGVLQQCHTVLVP